MKASRRRILIIDDMDANRYVLKKILTGEPLYEVVEAGSGAEGLEQIDDATDLVIIDINLPDMSGFELIQAMKRKLGSGKMPAVINISATFMTGKDKAMGLNQGAQAYLTHPINSDEVLATIASLLKSSNRFERIEKQRNVAVARSENLRTEKVMLERFMRSLSHDLRSPLSAAVMVAGLMRKNPARRTDDMIKVLEENLQRIDQMISNVLDISHMSLGGGLRLHGEAMPLGRLLGDAVENLRFQVSNPVHLDADADDLMVFWDKQGFLRILDNLVINAAKHGQPGMPIEVTQRQQDGGVLLSVSNHGSFPEDVLSNLATPYFISTRSETKGWGLGLPIVKVLSESFGGHTRFRNEAGRVIVDVQLPLSLRI
ncbi:ATP-binding response regulator [Stutzerimonas azotifigens]|uniref:histidine kinase n=1 Tax=Stutzerimonas azotifigens TaxID=291995 RepID=A0ABR5Z1N0_9GAMM|nr:response regulator [Stutzerimonas azotifigens]MBA1274130.1 hybrid sensor histidine kinase/response regulator [Stutzerimonas azotifigens]